MRLMTILPGAGLVLLLAACGQPAPSGGDAPGTNAGATTQATAGQAVYNRNCALCHAAGVAGAPKPGDTADWGPRIAQGMDVLYTHSIEGYTGSKGMMPPKGGAANLSDDEVRAAVDYMVAQSR